MATKHVYLTLAVVDGEPTIDTTLDQARGRRRVRLTHEIMRNDPAFVFPIDATVEMLERDTIVYAQWEV